MGNTVNNGENKSQKTIFVIRYFHPFIGGLEKKALNLASQLMQRGCSVEVVTSRFRQNWLAHELVKGVPVCRLPSPRIKFFGALIFLFCLFIYLIKKRHQYNIIHAFQVGYSSAIAVFVGRLLGKPTVLSLACSGSGGDILRHRRTPWGRSFLRLCRHASRIVVLNREMHRELQIIQYDSQCIVKIPNGVDLSQYRQAADRSILRSSLGLTGEIFILYAGRLDAPQKMVDVLIRAYAGISVAVPTMLYILGDGPDRSSLKRLAAGLGLESRVKILSAVEDITMFLQCADIFVMPSRYEGLSNSILEAMACGVPVIATRVTGNKELVTDGINGLLVEPCNIAQLTEALSCLIKNPDKGSELGSRAHELVKEHYDLYNVAEKYITLYRDLP